VFSNSLAKVLAKKTTVTTMQEVQEVLEVASRKVGDPVIGW
jgi:hypothetical protein